MMLKNVQHFSCAGGTCNEDAFVVGHTFAAVIDGASGLNPIHFLPAVTDASWMVHRLASLLEEHLSDIGRSINEILASCAIIIKRELDAMGYDAYQQSYPSACVSVVRLNAGMIECFYLGDCPILLLSKVDGAVKVMQDDAVPKRDHKVVEWICREHERNGISVAEASKYATDLLKKNRQEMNTPGTYWIFEPTGAGIPYIKHFVGSVADYSSAIIMSDGFYDAIDLYGIAECSQTLFSELGSGCAIKIYDDMHRIQMQDDSFEKYPRLKKTDDATAVYMQFDDTSL